jgi:hypothetical protein
MPALRYLPRFLWRGVKREFSYASAVREMKRRWRSGVAQRPHSLAAPLIVSLTSYPPRFEALENTLKCLLRQTVRPDATVLWIASDDRASLPPGITRLANQGLTIAFCEDLRSYKKIIPALGRYPDSFIATADDDFYVWPTWLEELIKTYDPNAREVLCHRMHRVRAGSDGLPLPYLQWELSSNNRNASLWHFPTGGAGALFPPGSFHADVRRADKFLALCPDADDVWLYWMLLLNRTPTRKAGGPVRLTAWRNSQRVSLFRTNIYRNDEQIFNLVRHYGFPLRADARTHSHA